MDGEQKKFQFLGSLGILKEAYSIASSGRKILSQISGILIVPLAAIYLAQIQITNNLFTRVKNDEYMLDAAPEGTRFREPVSNLLASELTAFVLFKIGYIIIFVLLALLSTSAVVYTIACIYTGKETSFRKVMSVVPKVLKRLSLTFVWNFIIIFAYNLVFLLVIVFCIILLGWVKVLAIIFLIGFLIAYLCGLLYMCIIWHLAYVVSVLEESYGLKAMQKSQNLIKGKIGVTAGVYFLLGISLFAVEFLFNVLVVVRDEQSVGSRIGFGILCLILLSIAFLFSLIAKTVVYFVCKSYHHENIDKSSLADHLEGYLGEYVPLKSRDAQLEQFEV